MIDPESRTAAWIDSLRVQYPNIKDASLLEKAIRALSLLESLEISGCPFVFKGGTALMLHLNSSRRLSIDVDIVCKPGLDIREYIGKNAKEYGFTETKEIERTSRNNVPKSHAEYRYEVSYPSGHPSDKILLDVLYEDIEYNHTVDLPIESPLLKTEGEPIMVTCPSMEDMLGDKLTAFAPHTTGIPFFKKDKAFSMEIMKQLFDIGSIFDLINDLSIVRKTFLGLVPIELGYRKMDHLSPDDVLEDAYKTALNICLRGGLSRQEYEYLTNGAHRVGSFIIVEKYSMEKAIRDAAKVAYLTQLILYGRDTIQHYKKEMDDSLAAEMIRDQKLNILNRIKKISLEAFYYCRRLEELQSKKESLFE